MSDTPALVHLDVFETLLSLEPLRERLQAVGLPGSCLEHVFARTLRDGMALTLTGDWAPFADLVAGAVRAQAEGPLDDDAVAVVASGFAELPLHADVRPGLELLAERGVRVRALTHGSAEVADAALRRGGVRDLLEAVVSAADVRVYKPAPAAYRYAVALSGVPVERSALVAAHGWDVHGARRAGLRTGLVARRDALGQQVFAAADVSGHGLDDVARHLLG